MKIKTPTIKGLFVKSHLKALVKAKGKAALEELKKRYCKPIAFKNLGDIPVEEEEAIIGHCLDIQTGWNLSPDWHAFEAGRLHFNNFLTTPLAKLLLSQFKKQFKSLMMMSDQIGHRVFTGTEFHSRDTGPNSVTLTMKDNCYHIEHFKGFFQAWMDFSNLHGTVESKQLGPNFFEYVMRWE